MKVLSPFSVPANYFDGKVKSSFEFQCLVKFPETDSTYETTYTWDSATGKVSKTVDYADGCGPRFSSIARLESFDCLDLFLEWVKIDASRHFDGRSIAYEISHQGQASHCPAWRRFIVNNKEYWQQSQPPKIHDSRLMRDGKNYCQVVMGQSATWVARYDYGNQTPVTFAVDSVGKVPLFNAVTRRYEDWHCGDLRRAIESGNLKEVEVEQI